MKKEEIQVLFKSFEDAKCMIDDTECWSARELQKLLGYAQWRNFSNVIDKAREACKNVGQEVSDHFADVSKKVELGSGSERDIENVMLTRYAHSLCLLPCRSERRLQETADSLRTDLLRCADPSHGAR